MRHSNSGNVKSQAPVAIINNLNKRFLWTNVNYDNIPYVTQINKSSNLYVQNDLLVVGSINNFSDIKVKQNIENLDLTITDDLLSIIPKKYNLINDNKTHFGFLAQDVELYYPNLVKNIKTEENDYVKTVNYLEFIPLLLLKIQDLQSQINELKERDKEQKEEQKEEKNKEQKEQQNEQQKEEQKEEQNEQQKEEQK
jgi:hypothetical protein